MNRILYHSPLSTDLAALILRLIFGGFFIYYGWLKIDSYHAILPNFTDIIGIGAKLSFHLLIFAEFFCGILIVLGLFTRLAVIPIFIAMIVAYFIAHAKDGFVVKQLPFLYILLSIPVFILGGGKYSLDRLIFRRRIPQPFDRYDG